MGCIIKILLFELFDDRHFILQLGWWLTAVFKTNQVLCSMLFFEETFHVLRQLNNTHLAYAVKLFTILTQRKKAILFQLSFLNLIVVSEKSNRILRNTTILHHIFEYILGFHAASYRHAVIFFRLRFVLTCYATLIPFWNLPLLANPQIFEVLGLTSPIYFMTVFEVALHCLTVHFLEFGVVDECLTGILHLRGKFEWLSLSVRF